MDLKTIEWIVIGLRNEYEALQTEVKELRSELRKNSQINETKKEDDELLDTKQVLNYLGVCYNTLRSVIQKGLIQPIRINQRRVKYSKREVLNYVSSLRKQETTITLE
jgi:hypothetical protein